jgi:hypothetical protein
VSDAPVVVTGADAPLVTGGESRVSALRQSVAGLRVRAARGGVERWLFIAGSVLAPLGLLLVILGWYGTAHTPYQFEQMPYMISGGLLGLALTVLGGLAYFAHWLTRLTASQQEQADRIVAALERLHDGGAHVGNGAVEIPAASAPAALVATPSGTMVHRPDCVVVANRPKLRKIKAGAAGFSPCKLCDPYDDVAATSGAPARAR